MDKNVPHIPSSDGLELDVVLKMIIEEAINTSGIGVSGILRLVAQGSRERYVSYRSTLATMLQPVAKAHRVEMGELLLIADNVDAPELTDAAKIEDIANQIDERPEPSFEALLAKIKTVDARLH